MVRFAASRSVLLALLVILVPPTIARADGGKLAEARSEAEKADVVAGWVGRAWRNYPEIDFNDLRIGQDIAYYGMLFSDEYFEPVFGKPYLSLTNAEREEYRRLLSRLNRYRNEKFGGRYVNVVSVAFKAPAEPGQPPRGDQGVVEKYRTLVPELNEKTERWHAAMAELESLPGNAESFRVVEAKLPAWTQGFAGLWPDQLERLGDAADRVKRDAAEEVLNAMVDAAIAGPNQQQAAAPAAANAPNDEGAVRNTRAEPGTGNRVEARRRDETRRGRDQTRSSRDGTRGSREEARRSREEALAQQATQREEALAQRAQLDEARRRQRELEETAGPAPSQRTTGDPRYDRAIRLQYLLWERQDLFALAPEDARERVRARIADAIQENLGTLVAEQSEAVDDFGSGVEAILNGSRWYSAYVQNYLGVFDHPIVQEPLRRFEQRRAPDLAAGQADAVEQIGQIKSAAALSEATGRYLAVATDRDTVAGKVILAAIRAQRPVVAWEQEKKKYSPAELALMSRPGVLRVPDDYGPPTAREVELAFLRGLAFTGGELLDGHTVKIGHAPLQNVFFIYLHTKPFKVTQTMPVEQGGYVCEFLVDFEAELPESLVDPDDGSIGAIMVRHLVEMAEDALPARMVASFVMEPSGWQSPSIRFSSFESMLQQDAELADFARKLGTGLVP